MTPPVVRAVCALTRIVAAVIAAALLVPASALADGDPASDVLLGQNVFYPYSPSVSPSLQKTLNGETAAARRAHFPIKVALIRAPIDLGAVPTLFGKPQDYAGFLDGEIGLVDISYPLLVVMPNGYGVQDLGPAATRAAASLAPPSGRQSDDLARAAIIAVPKLAAAAGHPIASSALPADVHRSSPVLPIIVLALVAVALAGLIVAGRRLWAKSH